MSREKEEMEGAWGVHGIYPLLVEEMGSVGRRRDRLEISAKVVFVKEIASGQEIKSCFKCSPKLGRKLFASDSITNHSAARGVRDAAC